MPLFLKLFTCLLLIAGSFCLMSAHTHAQSEPQSQSEQLKALQQELAERQQKLARD